MENVKFTTFSKLEESVKESIVRKFPAIKDTDLIYCENLDVCNESLFKKMNDIYIVKEVEEDGVDIVRSRTGERESFGIDEKVKKALEDAPNGFTIYGKEPAEEEAGKALREQAYKTGVKYFGVASDRAGVLVGNDKFRTVVFNGCGEDGTTFVIVDPERKINPGDSRCVSVLEGEFNIYGSDCQTDEVMETLNGTYVVMTDGDVVLFQKSMWAD